MKKIDVDKLVEGLLVTGRNNKTAEGKVIRVGVHSESNHNAMVVRATQKALDYLEDLGDPQHGIKAGDLCIAEAKPPFSTLTSIADYEKSMNADGYEVGFYRLRSFTKEQNAQAAAYFVDNLLGLPYPRKRRMIVMAMPLYNMLVDKGILPTPPIRLNWCSQLCMDAFLSVDPDALDGRDGKKKTMFTPRTFENRILFHLFEDLTLGIVITI